MIDTASFRTTSDKATGRRIVQLTQGEGFCYPLYYFIPSVTKEGRYLIHHRAEAGEVQLHRLDLSNGESVQITDGTCEDTHWRQWCVNSGSGVLDHRSVLNVSRGEVIYFDGPIGNEVRTVDVETLNDRLLFTLPDDRIAIGQNCTTTDGDWFVYIHADRELYLSMFDENRRTSMVKRSLAKGTQLAAYHIASGEHRSLLSINSPIHHVLAIDETRLLFCHPATENGMLLADINGGWYTHLRTQDVQGGTVCHFVSTKRGVAYEVLGPDLAGSVAGLYDPSSHDRFEFPLPTRLGYTHTGCDPEGKHLFFESMTDWSNGPDCVHDMHYLLRHHERGDDEWLALTGNRRTYGVGQKSHFHPRFTPDGQWIIYTDGDQRTESNHIHLLDATDLPGTAGLRDLV